ncbi:hypothetical protein GCM10025858_15000 [Alicyclobacillus sacchari]|nr:hypothetical protein GCM10025858_15000 [Alicyclobacillus sacchari]
MGRLFGTDGVRGVANSELTPELAFRLGRAGAYVLTSRGLERGSSLARTLAFPAICLKQPWSAVFYPWVLMHCALV